MVFNDGCRFVCANADVVVSSAKTDETTMARVTLCMIDRSHSMLPVPWSVNSDFNLPGNCENRSTLCNQLAIRYEE